MRPALLRLLKRPLALSIIDTLAATSIGIEQLESRYTRIRCRSRCARDLAFDDERDKPGTKAAEKTANHQDEGLAFSFPVYDIELPDESQTCEPSQPIERPERNEPPDRVKRSLRLHPDRLAFESLIGHTNDIGSRLVDRAEHKNDFVLWEELLRFRQRHWGDEGTLEIWKGLTVRVDRVYLPVQGERADFFWQSFVDLGLKRELFLKDLVDYASNLAAHRGSCWSELYQRIVGGLLDRGMKNQAIEWHKILQGNGLAGPDDLVHVLRPALYPTQPESSASHEQENALFWSPRLDVFARLCRATPGHQIYALAIATLLQQGCGEDAMALHNFLIRHEDHPETPRDMLPLLDYAKKYGVWEEFKRLRSYASERFKTEDQTLEQNFGDQINTDVPDLKSTVPGGEPFKDDIGARLFATRALNFDMVLGALKMLGVSAIGPRTIREMALRAHGSQDIIEKMKILRQSHISIGDTVFVRLVQKLAGQNREILLSDLLQSDQHPDVLEDTRMQESLLVSYYMARDSRQYNLSLAILAELFPDSSGLSDIHFRKHIAAGESSAALKIVDELTLQGKPLNEVSMDFMAEQILTPRRMNRRPSTARRLSGRLSPKEGVMFIFKVLKRVVPAGGYVNAAFWVELLKRLGMENQWDDLRECCLWLVRQYAPPGRRSEWQIPWKSQSRSETTTAQDSRMVKLIFTPKMQRAIVAWGFRYRVTNKTESKVAHIHPTTRENVIPWTRGIILLRELEQAGLGLRVWDIRHAIRLRLAMLYGRYCHSARRMNRMLRRNNPYSLRRVLGSVIRAWGDSSLFGVNLSFSQLERLVNPRRSPLSRRHSAQVRLSRRRK